MVRALACVLIAALAMQQQPAETATIAGRVVDGVTGAPIARAVVVVGVFAANKVAQKLTGTDGRFEISGLPAGDYTLIASAGEFRASHVPYEERSGPSTRLKAGERRELSIALPRAHAISGRVLDEAGLPLSNVSIRVRNLTTGNDFFHFRQARTDDLGAFRVYGLVAGHYIVCAGAENSPRFGPVTGPRAIRFVETCFPSSPTQGVPLRDADADGIEIRMRRSPTFTISGMVVDSSGNVPESYAITVTRIERNGSSGSNREHQKRGFTVSNLLPGRYVVSAQIHAAGPRMSGPLEIASLPVEITSEDVEGLVLTTRKGVTVRGVVTFEDGPPERARNPPLRVYSQQLEPTSIGHSNSAADVQPDLTFELKHLFGPNTVNINLPAGFAVKSILYRGRDIREIPTEFDGNPGNVVEIIVTRRVAELSGRVLDERGNAVNGARVHVFPADPARWKGWMQGAGSVAESGVFRVRALAPGDYLVVAISEQDFRQIAGPEWIRPNPYERLATIAEPVTLLENDRRVIDLRVTPIPQEWKR